MPNYVNKKYEEITRVIKVSEKLKGKITIECDEMHSFVERKDNKQLIWLALDKNTKEIVGAYIGKKDSDAAPKLWESLPPVYRQCAGKLHRFLESL